MTTKDIPKSTIQLRIEKSEGTVEELRKAIHEAANKKIESTRSSRFGSVAFDFSLLSLYAYDFPGYRGMPEAKVALPVVREEYKNFIEQYQKTKDTIFIDNAVALKWAFSLKPSATLLKIEESGKTDETREMYREGLAGVQKFIHRLV